MALKRVCDITGTDRDVEICEVTIAGQSIKLDLSPAGADRLREFFGPVITVRHPHTDPGSNGPVQTASGDDAAEDDLEAEFEAEAEAADGAADEDEDDEEAVESASAQAEPEPALVAAAERPVRRGRRPASVKGARKKVAVRRAAKPVVQTASQATAEIREWARANGFEVGERGAIPGRIRSAYTLAHE